MISAGAIRATIASGTHSTSDEVSHPMLVVMLPNSGEPMWVPGSARSA